MSLSHLNLTPANSFVRRYGQPLFQGAYATRAAQARRLNRPEDLMAVVKRDDTPYIGSLPPELLADTELGEAEVLKLLDHMADKIRRMNLQYEPDPCTSKAFQAHNRKQFGLQALVQAPLERFGAWLQGKTLPESGLVMTYIDSGCVGHVFRLSTRSHSYAFKVSKDYTGDIANGHYFTQLGTYDIPQFYMGNPLKNWALMEYLDHKTPLPEPDGRRSLAEHGFKLADTKARNRLAGRTVDLDAVIPISGKSILL